MRGISEGNWPELHGLFADDAVIDYPFVLPAPTRLDGGEAIRRYFSTIASYGLELRARDVVLHETADPEVVIAEWDYDGRVASSGRTFCVSNITVSACACRLDRGVARRSQPPGPGRRHGSVARRSWRR